MRKFFIILLGILFLAVVALIVVPPFINWNNYKDFIQSNIKIETGLDVAIDGNMKLRLLPTPAFAIQKVKVKAPDACREKEFLTLDSAELHLALWPLLSRSFHVESLTLVKPKLTVDLREGCQYKDLFKTSKGSESSSQETQKQTKGASLFQAAEKSESESKSTLPEVKISLLTIENGEITFVQNNKKEVISNINGDFSLDSLQGPFETSGQLQYKKQTIDFKSKIGSLVEVSPTNAQLNLVLGKDTVDLSGQLQGGLENPNFKGKLVSDLFHNNSFLEEFIGHPDFLKGVLKFETEINFGKKGGDLNNIKVKWDDLHAEGNITLMQNDLWDFKGQLKISPIQLSNFLHEKKLTNTKISVIKEALASDDKPLYFDIPKNINAQLGLLFEGITYQKQVWRDVKVNLGLKNGVAQLDKLTIDLPGGNAVIDGTLQSVKGIPNYQGKIHLKTDNLANIMKMAGKPIKNFPKTSTFFSSEFKGDSTKLFAQNIEAKFDQLNLKGNAEISLNDFTTNGQFHLGEIDLDSFLVKLSKVAFLEEKTAEPKIHLIASKEKDKNSSKGIDLSFLNGPDFNLKLTCPKIKYKDQILQNLATSLSLKDEKLTINDLKGQMEELFFTLKGSLEEKDNKAKASFIAQAKGKVKQIGDLQFNCEGDGTLDKLDVKTSFFAFGANGQIRGDLNPLDPLSYLKGYLKIDHPEAGFLMGSTEKWGPLSLETPVQADNGKILLSSLQGALGRNTFKGHSSIDFKPNLPFMVLNLELNQLNVSMIEEPDPLKLIFIKQAITQNSSPSAQSVSQGWSREPLNLEGLKKFEGDFVVKANQFLYGKIPLTGLNLSAKLRNAVFHLDDLSSSLMGGQLKANAIFESQNQNNLKFNLNLSNIDLASATQQMTLPVKFTGKLVSQMAIQGKGRSLYDLMSSLVGKVDFSTINPVLVGYDLVDLNQKVQHIHNIKDFLSLLSATTKGGQTTFDEVKGQFVINQGIARTENTVIRSKAGLGQAKGNIDIAHQNLNMNISYKLESDKDFPPLSVDVTGNWTNPRTHLDSSQIENFLIQKGVTSLAKKLLEDKKKKKEDESQNNNNGNGAQPKKKKKIFDDLLDQVLGNEAEDQQKKEATLPANDSNQGPENQHEQNEPQEEPKKKKHRTKDILQGVLQGIL